MSLLDDEDDGELYCERCGVIVLAEELEDETRPICSECYAAQSDAEWARWRRTRAIGHPAEAFDEDPREPEDC